MSSGHGKWSVCAPGSDGWLGTECPGPSGHPGHPADGEDTGLLGKLGGRLGPESRTIAQGEAERSASSGSECSHLIRRLRELVRSTTRPDGRDISKVQTACQPRASVERAHPAPRRPQTAGCMAAWRPGCADCINCRSIHSSSAGTGASRGSWRRCENLAAAPA